ncbi:hypothetical protein A1E_04635 [Rickettsia canadensis str. McKiel]|uniref:Uncharacterized protein n=1 Tax=Rickettsia canadensis (strain McKiel) TaxID=293613 RepID=A8EZR9_RICCK|nr:hypothetical protein A1E_04635 [Rickettsia canadensis str. McKiel]
MTAFLQLRLILTVLLSKLDKIFEISSEVKIKND